MKQYHFLCSITRSGVTLLSSILNQSKQLQVILMYFVNTIINLLEVKNTSYFKILPYQKGIDNIIEKLFDNYYNDIDTKVILDRAPWGTPWNLNILKNIFKKRKFIILYRPPLECLASLIKSQNVTKISKNELINFCEKEMNKFEGSIGKNIWSMRNIIKENEDHIIINYDDLVNDTRNQVKKIFKFLKLKQEKIDLKNIKQFKFANMRYDDSMHNTSMHTIRTNKIKQIKYDIEKYLPKSIIDEYKDY